MQLCGIKSLQLFTRKCGIQKMLLTEHFCKKQLPHAFLVTSTSLQSNKKDGYEQVSKKYEDLHRSVTSFKDRPRTPETLFKEDNLIYGPVIKCRAPDKAAEAKTPKNWVPLLNPSKKTVPLTDDPRLPLKVSLGKHSIPSVTNVLQQTMSAEQAFYLNRWKQQMILKLGEDGFAEYNKSKSNYNSYKNDGLGQAEWNKS